MDIGNALRKAGKEKLTTQSIIANSIQKYYEEKTGRKIVIQSVQIRWKKILIKTGNALISSELQMMQWDIHPIILKKLSQLTIHIPLEMNYHFT